MTYSPSFATVNAQNLDLGPMIVKYDGVDLGGTLGNVTITYKYEKTELKMDQLGSTPVNRGLTGLSIQVSTEIAEIQNKDNWKVVFPHADLIDGGGGNKAIRFMPKMGQLDSDLWAELSLHPMNRALADLSGDYTFPLAVSAAESEIVHGPGEQKKLKLVWNVYPDLGQSGYPFCIFGDTGIGIVPAAAGSPAFTGTGNGTLTAVAVYSGTTKTETITVKCIGDSGSHTGVFLVTGSLSGTLGSCELPGSPGGSVGFSSGVISFTITDGSTDFVVNDQWTIATTSANYS